VSVSTPPALGSSGRVRAAHVSLRLCAALALCWALPGTAIGGYILARYLTAAPAAPGGGAVTGAGLQVLPQGTAPSISFAFLLVLLSAILFLGPLAFAGLAYVRDSSAPGQWGSRAAWLGAVAAGAVVEASWIGPADQQALQKLAPGTIPPWSSLSMFLGHLAAGTAMLAILRAAGRPGRGTGPDLRSARRPAPSHQPAGERNSHHRLRRSSSATRIRMMMNTIAPSPMYMPKCDPVTNLYMIAHDLPRC
jgi:hypothetical protein